MSFANKGNKMTNIKSITDTKSRSAHGVKLARKVKRPKMSMHFGRTWDHCTVILGSGESIRAHIDYTWGSNAYFEFEGNWYAVPYLLGYDYSETNHPQVKL